MSTGQRRLDDTIENMDLGGLTPAEVASEARKLRGKELTMRAARKKVRYTLYRLKTEVSGGPASGATDDFREFYEVAEGFDGWRNFSVTWDVAIDDPERVVSRTISQADEWEAVFNAKVPIILPGGKIEYPDKSVEKAMKKVSGK